MDAICVFCGSNPGRDPVYLQQAETLGRLLEAMRAWTAQPVPKWFDASHPSDTEAADRTRCAALRGGGACPAELTPARGDAQWVVPASAGYGALTRIRRIRCCGRGSAPPGPTLRIHRRWPAAR